MRSNPHLRGGRGAEEAVSFECKPTCVLYRLGLGSTRGRSWRQTHLMDWMPRAMALGQVLVRKLVLVPAYSMFHTGFLAFRKGWYKPQSW